MDIRIYNKKASTELDFNIQGGGVPEDKIKEITKIISDIVKKKNSEIFKLDYQFDILKNYDLEFDDSDSDLGKLWPEDKEKDDKKGYKISIGELFDLLAIANIKIWHLEERISKLSKSKKDKDKIEMGELTRLIRAANRERVSMKEELNLRLEGKTRALGKVEHTKLGR